MIRAMLELAHAFDKDAAPRQWLLAGDFGDWEAHLNGTLRHSITDFLGEFGYRTTGEGELAHPRWNENPAKLFSALATYVTEGARQPVALPANAHAQKLADAAAKAAKEVPGVLDDIRSALLLQSKALNATAYILGGTRRWALAAGREATTDGRLNEAEEVFFYELEEIKQMMTGEWNISAIEEIRATAARRRQEYAVARQMMPGDLLIGDAEAFPAVTGLPATEGRVSGPLRRNGQPHPPACNGAIIGAEQLDSGWSLLLPIAKGLISAYGTPMDPIAAAGRIWHTPMMVGVGPRYADLVDGAQTVLDLDEIMLDQ
jgi:pyruvate,water dikinase